jgi:hypothetical protein
MNAYPNYPTYNYLSVMFNALMHGYPQEVRCSESELEQIWRRAARKAELDGDTGYIEILGEFPTWREAYDNGQRACD